MHGGGARPGAGRPAGYPNRAPLPAEEWRTRGDPLQYLLDLMNDPTASADRRDRAAVAGDDLTRNTPRSAKHMGGATAHRREASERQRRYRARQRACVAVYHVEVGGEVLDMLVRLGWLRDSECGSRREVAKAVAALLADAAKFS